MVTTSLLRDCTGVQLSPAQKNHGLFALCFALRQRVIDKLPARFGQFAPQTPSCQLMFKLLWPEPLLSVLVLFSLGMITHFTHVAENPSSSSSFDKLASETASMIYLLRIRLLCRIQSASRGVALPLCRGILSEIKASVDSLQTRRIGGCKKVSFGPGMSTSWVFSTV